MKAIKDMHRIGGALCDHVHVLSPHVGANELQACQRRLRNRLEESSQAVLGAVFGDVQPAPTTLVDLVDQRQIPVPSLVRNFVDAECFDVPDLPVHQSPTHDPVDRSENRVPTAAEDCGSFLPGEPLGPAGQEDPVAISRLMLAVGPGDSLDLHAAIGTLDTTHRIDEVHRDCPQWHELETTLEQTIVAGPFLATTVADRTAASVRLD